MRSKKLRQVTEDPKDKLRQEIDVMQKKLNDLKSFNSELQINKKHLTNKSDFQTRLDEILKKVE
jgi:phage shock protein A